MDGVELGHLRSLEFRDGVGLDPDFYNVNVRVPSGRYWSVLSAVVHDGQAYYAGATPDFNVVNTTTCHT